MNPSNISVSCHYTRMFWAEVIKWFSDFNVNIHQLSDKNIMLGILDCEDYLFVNHILLIMVFELSAVQFGLKSYA